jgi:hypothetical protein
MAVESPRSTPRTQTLQYSSAPRRNRLVVFPHLAAHRTSPGRYRCPDVTAPHPLTCAFVSCGSASGPGRASRRRLSLWVACGAAPNRPIGTRVQVSAKPPEPAPMSGRPTTAFPSKPARSGAANDGAALCVTAAPPMSPTRHLSSRDVSRLTGGELLDITAVEAGCVGAGLGTAEGEDDPVAVRRSLLNTAADLTRRGRSPSRAGRPRRW